jgi:hypothetical protein
MPEKTYSASFLSRGPRFDPEKRDLVADDVLSAFARVFDLSQTPRLKDTLRNALYVLIEKDLTLVNLLMLLADERV